MNFHSIRFRYTFIFCTIAIFYLISLLFNFSLVSKTKNGIALFSQSFNPSISAVLNGDRDLYQARVAELNVLIKPDDGDNQQSFDENAQQAFDRMQKYKTILLDYPAILTQLEGFDNAFNNWKESAQLVFNYAKGGQTQQAQQQSYGESLKNFNTLRDFFNHAGELADEASRSDSEKIIHSVDNRQNVLTIISSMIILFTFLMGIIAPKTMTDALNKLSDELQGLNSGDGDLSRRINSTRKDEIGKVANNLDQLMDGFSTLIGSILTQSTGVIKGVDDLSQGAFNVKKTSQQQSEKVDVIVTAVTEMSYAIKEVATNAQLSATEIEQVNTLTAEGKNITQDSVNRIEQLSQAVLHASQVISKLSDKSNDIASVLDVIRGIAEQTNLLALNAAIEAARAGEHGRGFAVVADEVRSLASKTQESTQSIQSMIEGLQSGVKEAVESIQVGSDATLVTVELSNKTLQALELISAAASKVSDVALHTATATEEQGVVAQDISMNLNSMASHTQENLNLAEENSEQATKTKQAAQTLSNTVSRFKLS